MLCKIHDGMNCDYNVASEWVVSVKSSLINHNGSNPNQLVFEKNANNLKGRGNGKFCWGEFFMSWWEPEEE